MTSSREFPAHNSETNVAEDLRFLLQHDVTPRDPTRRSRLVPPCRVSVPGALGARRSPAECRFTGFHAASCCCGLPRPSGDPKPSFQTHWKHSEACNLLI